MLALCRTHPILLYLAPACFLISIPIVSKWSVSPLNAIEPTKQVAAAANRSTRLDQAISPLFRQDLNIGSSASCSATACHGGPRPGISNLAARRGSEYPLWLENDPHSRSWRTFCSQQSVAMMERLKIMRDGRILDRRGYDNCLACHNTTRQFDEPRTSAIWREGVGCDGCHGPSQRWRETHFQSGWNSQTAVADGFVQVDNMLVRARMCATCHIGDRDRDMNHDIIAAGHPALHYEFATYHQRQPKHWREPHEQDALRFEATQWLCGQIAALDASLVLLETRARQSHSASVWPEFAAFNCSACHQHVRLGRADFSIPESAARPVQSTAEWSHWNRFGIELLLSLREHQGTTSDSDRRMALELERLAGNLSDTTRSAEDIANQAGKARLALDQWLKSPEATREIQRFSASRLQELVIHASRQPSELSRWEKATQFYLASVAARAAWPKESLRESSNASPEATARQLRNLLTFARGSSSPQARFEGGSGEHDVRDTTRGASASMAIESHAQSLSKP